MIIDTNALSAIADDDRDAVAILAKADVLAIPAVVLGEYRYGIALSRHRAAYERWLTGLLSDCLLLDINESTTQHYADIAVELRRNGKLIPTNDLWIAALCRQHAMPILSRDHHFELVQHVKRIDW
jgi:tRNA(fMet)-specific endonuclease VapC